ncbi:AAA family ATPase [Xenophilus azovorans]|uniref:AAA family ATPase n=1 Tax=Xenophilus azovorans TaxID=151755 RepID=UPI000A021277|nr:AAA family ATPase [Xenophilus azovorans]
MNDPTSNALPDAQALRAQLAERSAHLQAAAATLKQELFGIDAVIDRVIESVRAWYVLPKIVTRPVIVCLWGLTGTGKTQLVRRLAQLLGFQDRFVEVQMDGFSHGASGRGPATISGLLAQGGMAEGAPGVLVLDEFQRYRTVDEQRKDARVERYQDVWALLSDGRLPLPLSLLGEIETAIAGALYDADREAAGNDGDGDAPARRRRFSLSTWEAEELRRNLKLDAPLTEVMAWTPGQMLDRLRAFQESRTQWETDYSRLLVFVCGNLDEMYEEMATRVEDCDTDADIFHALTRGLSVIDVKKALAERFKPEQIARLGNDHVIYPSLSRAAYEQLIRHTCERYVEETRASAGVGFVLDASVHAQLYADGVFPAQGTRPLFSSIHAILSATLVQAALWALEHGAAPGDTVHLSMAGGRLRARFEAHERHFDAPLDLSRARRRTSEDFRCLLAMHEAGHGLAYALLFGHAPLEVRINVASFEGGYNSYAPRKAWSRRNLLDSICVSLAGRAAERLVFGDAHATSGAEGDLRKATATAARMVRHLGFGPRLSHTDVADGAGENVNTSLAPTNAAIEALLREQQSRADGLIAAHTVELLTLVDELLRCGSIAPARFVELLKLRAAAAPSPGEPIDAYAMRLAAFRAAAAPRRRAPGRRPSRSSGCAEAL